MDLTIQEAATLLGRRPRTVRAQVARGDIPGFKKGGQWWIPQANLPLTETQRAALQARAEEVRGAVESALPAAVSLAHDKKRWSVTDLEAFCTGRRVLNELRTNDQPRAAEELEAGLLALCEGSHLFDPRDKIAALDRARAHISRAAGRLLLTPEATLEDAPTTPHRAWANDLEGELIPALAGLIRRVEGRRR